MAVDIGPKIGIDGEAEFRKQINNLTQQLKTFGSEMQTVTTAFGKNQSSMEALTAKNEVLSKSIETQKQKIDALKQGLAESAEKYGENDTKTLKWQQAVNNATADLNKMQNELDDNKAAIDDFGKGVQDTGDALDDAGKSAATFGEVLRANVLAQAIVDGVKKLADGFKDFVKDAVESAANVKAEASQFTQTFGDMQGSATEAINRVASSSGILDTRLNALGSQIYAFARASGGDATESLGLMEKALQATADNAAYYDRSLDESAESLQSFLKGNFENDAALGLSATETTRNAAAMKQFGKEYNDLSEIQKQQTLLQMVLDAQELSGAMGQASREADGWENVQGNLNEVWRQFLAKVGTPILEQLIPVIQQITNAFQNWMNSVDWDAFNSAINQFVDTIKENKDMIIAAILGIGAGFLAWNVTAIITGVIASITKLGGVLPALAKGVQAVNAALKANIIGVVATAVIALGAAFVYLYNNSETFRTAIDKLVSELVNFFTVTVPAAFNSLVQAVQPGLDAVKDAVQTAWGKVQEVVTTVADTIRKVVSAAWDFISTDTGGKLGVMQAYVNTVFQYIQTIINVAMTAIQGIIKAVTQAMSGDWSGAWNTIKETASSILTQITDFVKTAFGNMLTGIKTTIGNIVSSVRSGLQPAIDFVASLPGKFLNWGKDMIDNLVSGIRSGIAKVGEAVGAVADKISSFLHFSEPDVGPLSNFHTFMPDMTKMLVSGIRAGIPDVASAVNDLSGEMVPKYSNGTADAYERMSAQLTNMQIVLQDGTLVGKLTPKINRALGGIRTTEGRFGLA